MRKLTKKHFDFFSSLKPKVIIHFEPCYEHFSTHNEYDLICKKYIELNDYNKNLVSTIKDYENNGFCKILYRKKRVIGFNPFLPISIIVWKPL